MIEVYKNKLIIYNLGGLVKWLKLEEFGKVSKARNSLIVSLLSRTPFLGKISPGIKRIRDAMKNQNLKESKFEYYKHSFYIELRDNKFDMESSSLKSQEKSSEKSSEKSLKIIKESKNITINELSKKLNLTTRAIEKNLSKLKADGKLKRIGSDKGGYWKVLE